MSELFAHFVSFIYYDFYDPATKSRGGHINLPCPSVRPSGYRYMVCPAISSYSFGATALIFCMMFIHIMEVDLFIISYGQAFVLDPTCLYCLLHHCIKFEI
jgi:hypothetical protein